MSILTVGTVAFDSIETSFGAADTILGGSATYIALAAQFFCDDIRLSAVVGGDFPESYHALLKQREIDLEGLRIDEKGKTFAWAGKYHEDMIGRETLYTHLNVLETFDPVLPESYKNSRLVCLGNLDPGIQRQVLEQVTNPSLVVCDTMNFWISHTPDSLKETLKLVDCLMVNDEEARQLAGENSLFKAAQTIMDMGPAILVIKKGEHGAMVITRDSMFITPAFPVESVQDPTGAGDTFMGGFVGYLSKYESFSDDVVRRAVVCGTTLASFTVERFGTDRLVDLTEGEIEARIHAFRDITFIPHAEKVATV